VFAAEYLTTALGMPFEVGKTLLQVEYKPKEGVSADEGVDTIPEEDPTGRDWGAEDDQVGC
jgi:mitochondrial fusion and transport protein UGO1